MTSLLTKDKIIFDVYNNNKNDNNPLLFNIKVVNELNNQIFEEFIALICLITFLIFFVQHNQKLYLLIY